MSRLERGMQRFADRLIAQAGVPVTYGRGDASIEIQAIPGNTSFDAASAEGIWSVAQADDWIVRAADLVIGGTLVLPAKEDWIRRTAGGWILTYRVRPLGDDRCYAELKPSGLLVRIHAKLVTRVAA